MGSYHAMSPAVVEQLDSLVSADSHRFADVLYDTRWFGNHGIGRFAQCLFRQIPTVSVFKRSRRPVHPLDPWLLGAELRHRQPRLFFSPGYNSPASWSGRFA